MRITRALPVALAVAVLTACGSGGASGAVPTSAGPGKSPTPGVVADATYSTVAALRDAAVEAGLDCPEFKPRDGMALAAEAADCSPSTVLMIYSSQERRDEQVDTLKELSADIGGAVLLVGPNWVVNADEPDLERIQPALGGIIDRSER